MSLPGANPTKKKCRFESQIPKKCNSFGWSVLRQKFAFSFWNSIFSFFSRIGEFQKNATSSGFAAEVCFLVLEYSMVWSAVHTAVHNVMDISPSSNPNQEMDVVADHEQVPIQHSGNCCAPLTPSFREMVVVVCPTTVPSAPSTLNPRLIDERHDHETPNKWMRLYGMHKWPPTMPTGRIRPDWRDWLMAPLIMSSINESWIEGRSSRRHSSWTYDDDHLPERWGEWCTAISTVLESYLLSNNLELNHIIKLKRSNRNSGPYTVVSYTYVDEMMSLLYIRYPDTHADIMIYSSSIQGISSLPNSSTSASNTVSDALIAVANHGIISKQLHEFNGAKKLAKEFVDRAFGLKMAFCNICNERWYKDKCRTEEYTCKMCLLDIKKYGTSRFGVDNGMNPMHHEDATAIDTYYSLLKNFPLSVVEESLISINISVMSVYRLKSQASLFKGNVIAFPQDLSNIVSSLPRLPSECKIFKLRVRCGDDPKGHKDFRVRKQYVKNWLEFLQRFNPYYRDIDISEQSLDALPEDDSCYEELKELFSNGKRFSSLGCLLRNTPLFSLSIFLLQDSPHFSLSIFL